MLSRLFQTLRLGFKTLFLHKLRSALAMIGILIGVTAVIWLVALGEGVSEQAQRQIQELGARNVIVRSIKPSSISGGEGSMVVIYGLTFDDYNRIASNLRGYTQRAVPLREIAREVRNGRLVLDCQLVGCTPDYQEINHLAMTSGRFIEDRDGSQTANVCVLGAETARTLFPLGEAVGSRVQIDLDFYTVIGVTRERSGSAAIGGSMAGREYNRDVYVPLSTFRGRIGDQTMTARAGSRDGELVEINQITLTLTDIEWVEEAAAVIRILLQKFHKQEDYTVVVPKELLKQAEVLRAMFNVLLVLIAGISLVVGGIGIMNIMLATVTERTREIGVRRALGARRQDIIVQFLSETVVLTGTGGIAGVVVGFLCGPAVAAVQTVLQRFLPDTWATLPPSIQQLSPIIAPWSVAAAFGISVGVGVLFGIYPARRAALMDPIEALRHE